VGSKRLAALRYSELTRKGVQGLVDDTHLRWGLKSLTSKAKRARVKKKESLNSESVVLLNATRKRGAGRRRQNSQTAEQPSRLEEGTTQLRQTEKVGDRKGTVRLSDLTRKEEAHVVCCTKRKTKQRLYNQTKSSVETGPVASAKGAPTPAAPKKGETEYCECG